jgi:myo-inositol-1(or 4)-monophosphatase
MPVKPAIIQVMERAARKAAPKLRRDFGEVEQLQVSRKGPADFVTQADKQSERTIVEELQKSRPDYGYLLEEGGEIAGQPGAPRFVVDPLDGTTNFLHGIPHFAISIAVEDGSEITAGIVYQPLTDETFWAVKGEGAYLENRRLRVSGRRIMAEALLATGVPFHGHGDATQFSAILAAVMPTVAGVRRFGSAALDLAWTAAGRYDGFWEMGLSRWDIAAGILLMRESGGIVTDYRGGADMLNRGDIVTANPALHSDLHKLIANAIRKLPD